MYRSSFSPRPITTRNSSPTTAIPNGLPGAFASSRTVHVAGSIAYSRYVSRLAIHNEVPSNARPSGFGAGDGRRNFSTISIISAVFYRVQWEYSMTREIRASSADMVSIPGGTFAMGSDDFYPEEAPVHEETVAAFQMDR